MHTGPPLRSGCHAKQHISSLPEKPKPQRNAIRGNKPACFTDGRRGIHRAELEWARPGVRIRWHRCSRCRCLCGRSRRRSWCERLWRLCGAAHERARHAEGDDGSNSATDHSCSPSWLGGSTPMSATLSPCARRSTRFGNYELRFDQVWNFTQFFADPGVCAAHWRITMTTASPPRLSISPVRFAFRCMITPASFCNQRSPALAVPIAKP